MPLQNKLIAVALLVLPAMSWALPSDNQEPINIEADHAQLDDREGVTQYKGDAILTQGTLRITGDIITFYYDANQQLTKAVAQGKRATYQQVHKAGDPPVKAKALQMEYYADRQKIYLIGEGHVWQNGDEFTGNRIEYDIERNLVVANSSPVTVDGQKQPQGRVHVIIQPPSKKSGTSNTSPKPDPAESAADSVDKTSQTDNAKPVSSEAESYPTAITTSRLNIRTGPGTQYKRIGSLPQQLQVLVLTRQEVWSQVRAEVDGEVLIGWVNSLYIE